eukprot:7224823-Prorocentrum_lima.AAC.1
MFHSRTHGHNGIHAQANLTLMYLCARQHPLLEWGDPVVLSVINRIQAKGPPTLLQHLNLARKE